MADVGKLTEEGVKTQKVMPFRVGCLAKVYEVQRNTVFQA